MKIRSLFMILCAGAVIVLGAMLPGLVGERQDAVERGRIQFAPVQEVRLEFADSGITMKQTLAIMGPLRDVVNIPEELATLKRSKVERIAADAAQRYNQAGVLLGDPGDFSGYSMVGDYTVLVYGPETSSNVFWIVDYGDPGGNSWFHMVIDDRTGTVCSVEYRGLEAEYASWEMQQILEGFCQTYLEGLGEEFFDYSGSDLADKADRDADSSYMAAQLRFDAWDDPLYGETRIVFFLNRNGFYTYFE